MLKKIMVIGSEVLYLPAFDCIGNCRASADPLYRYIWAAPLSWSEEIPRYLLVWISFFGAASCH